MGSVGMSIGRWRLSVMSVPAFGTPVLLQAIEHGAKTVIEVMVGVLISALMRSWDEQETQMAQQQHQQQQGQDKAISACCAGCCIM